MSRVSRNLATLVLSCAVSLAANAGQSSRVPGLDPRLADFLPQVIKDSAALRSEEETYAEHHVSFEQLILTIYTGQVQIDEPDNQRAIAQLGQYIDTRHPHIAPSLLPRLESYYADKKHQTMLRGMFLNTIRDAVKQRP